MICDYIIIGSGSVLAERISNTMKKKVMIIEKRIHIDGNSYDYYNEEEILIHKYGPHIFHTKSKKVWDYISNFTEWFPYQHKVLACIDGKKVPIPFNLNSLHQIFPFDLARRLKIKLIENFGKEVKIPILDLRLTDDIDLKFLADFIYEKVFLNYTKKQWGLSPDELDSSVTARVPVYISMDNRYFQDKYQGIPKEGYTKIFQKMLSNPNIKIKLNTDFREIIEIKEN